MIHVTIDERYWAVITTIDVPNAVASNASVSLTASVATLKRQPPHRAAEQDSSPAITHLGFRHCSNDAANYETMPLSKLSWALCGFTCSDGSPPCRALALMWEKRS